MIDLDNFTSDEIKGILKQILWADLGDDDCVEVIAEWAKETGMVERLREELEG